MSTITDMRACLLIFGLAWLAAASVVTAQTPSPLAQAPGVGIRFTGFTNTGPASVATVMGMPSTNRTIFGQRVTPGSGPLSVTIPRGPAAVFAYTNSSSLPTVCTVQTIEYQTTAGWAAVRLTSPPGSLLVPPHGTATQALPVSDTSVAWRIKVFCVEQATGVRRAVERTEGYVNELATGQKTERFSGRKYLTTSAQPVKQ